MLRTSIERVLGRINHCLAQPIITYPIEVHIRFSAGTAIAPEQAVDFENLLHLADQAVYESKNQGRGRHHFYCDQAINQMPVISEFTPLPESATATE
jgi:predicted signal transduction protein with EAL and GGDEF domain